MLYPSWFGKIKYQPVRPSDTVYDRSYHAQNEAGYNASRSKWCALVNSPVYHGKVQDWEEDAVKNGDLVDLDCYLLFDVHYYLAGWKPREEVSGQVYLVGGVFHPVIGRYQLPCG